MTRWTRRQWLLSAGSVAVLGSGLAWTRFQSALHGAELRVSGRSTIFTTPFGSMEFAEEGSGALVLMIHGTGGGFDQGLQFASALKQRGHRIVAPSRFGYLRSVYPSDPSLEHQADVYAGLLDHLGIDRIDIVGGSAGALSATAFALKYPERCSSLTLLVPAANVSEKDPVDMSKLQQLAVNALLTSDLVYWSAAVAVPEKLVGTLLATDPALLSEVSPVERERAFAILQNMMPIHARTRGLKNDADQAGHPAKLDFSRLKMPVLIISAEDDRFGTAATARKITEMVPQAQLTILPNGGHIWLGRDSEVADRIHAFLMSH